MDIGSVSHDRLRKLIEEKGRGAIPLPDYLEGSAATKGRLVVIRRPDVVVLQLHLSDGSNPAVFEVQLVEEPGNQLGFWSTTTGSVSIPHESFNDPLAYSWGVTVPEKGKATRQPRVTALLINPA